MLVIPRYVVTACETVTIYSLVFVVISKKEGLYTVERLHIPMVLGRMSTSSNSVEAFQHTYCGLYVVRMCSKLYVPTYFIL